MPVLKLLYVCLCFYILPLPIIFGSCGLPFCIHCMDHLRLHAICVLVPGFHRCHCGAEWGCHSHGSSSSSSFMVLGSIHVKPLIIKLLLDDALGAGCYIHDTFDTTFVALFTLSSILPLVPLVHWWFHLWA